MVAFKPSYFSAYFMLISSLYIILIRASAQLVLDYSGEHNIPITTNPNGFFLLFPCYLLLRAYALSKIRSPFKGEAVKCARLTQTIASPSRGEAGGV